MECEKSQEQKGGHQRGTEKQQQSSLCFIDGLCHLTNSELDPQFQKCKGRVVLRGDIVKDDSGAYAVFTEQGSSASQMNGSKSDGCHLQDLTVMDKQLTPCQHTLR